MSIIEIIDKKKRNKELTKEEIQFVIDNFVNDNIKDYQMSSLLMAILINGMTNVEIANLTSSMMHSGDVVDLSDIKGIKLDKHSTGGVGDKVSLVLGPIIAACGGIITKMSGRGLGHTGGTIDKLESIQGFNCFLSEEEFKHIIKKTGIAIVGQTENLVPADKKIYALRDVAGTVDSLPLIASSIMSKKLATGSDAILLDVKCGSGAFMKNVDDARELGKMMISIGKKLNKDIKVEISNMEQPLGRMIGNKNEVIEAMQSLKGQGEKNFMDLIYSSGSTMLMQAKITKTENEGKQLIKNVIESGAAYRKFLEMIEGQGGDSKIIQSDLWWKPSFIHQIKSKKTGYVKLSNSVLIGTVAMNLGAGRKTKTDILDFEAGIELNKVTNEFVNEGDVIMTLYSSNPIDNFNFDILEQTIEIKEKPIDIKMIFDKLS